MDFQPKEQINNLIKSIKDRYVILDKEVKRLKTKPLNNDKFDPNFWCLTGLGDALVKLRLIVEHNFNYIETLSFLATTRYIFELKIWLKLFKLSPYYGFIYYSELFNSQKKHWINNEKQLLREIKLLKEIEKEDKEVYMRELEKVLAIENEDESIKVLSNFATTVQRIIDDKAARYFSIYTEQARTNGYGYQAYLIENKVLPQIRNQINALDQEFGDIEQVLLNIKNQMPELLKKNKLELKDISWKEKASLVNMEYEYEYIYSSTSTLLHATPSSMTTNMKNIETSEILIFLKFINVSIQDIIDLAKTY